MYYYWVACTSSFEVIHVERLEDVEMKLKMVK
jgi:hypothetical protein